MLTTHVVSFGLSLALRDAGYPQEGGTFYWKQDSESGEPYLIAGNSRFMASAGVILAAPIASELMEVMKKTSFVVEPRHHQWACFFCPRKKNGELTGEETPFYAETVPDPLAKQWLYLNKKGLLK